MGLIVNKNDKGEFQLISTITDNSWHPHKEWISEAEAKRMLIEDAFNTFVERAIEIDMTFPKYANGKREEPKINFNRWLLEIYENNTYDTLIAKKFKELYKRLKLNIKIK